MLSPLSGNLPDFTPTGFGPTRINSGLDSKLKVIVSYPTRSANIYYRPKAAEKMGARIVFLTGLYYKPDRLPYSLVRYLPKDKRARVERLLEKRRFEGLSSENVVSLLGPLLETVLRPSRKLRQWFAAHDWLASQWISRYDDRDTTTPVVLHCFQDTCVRTLRAARGKRMVRLLEVLLPVLPGMLESVGSQEKEGLTLPEEVREADFVLVQSEFSARVVESLGARPEQIIRCHIGVDTNHFKPRNGPRRPGPLRILFLGGASPRKGIHHLIEAWKQANVEGAELLLGGNRSWGLDYLVKDTPNCRALGFLSESELVQVLQDADIVVHPSVAEGACNVVYEALACGVPCIVSTHTSSAVRPGKEGLVFPVGNIWALKEAIELLCGDPALRMRMSEAARKRAEALTWDNYLDNLAAVYRGLGAYAQSRSLEPLQALVSAGF